MSYSFRNIAILILALTTLGSCGGEEVSHETSPRPVKYTKVSLLGGAKSRLFSGTAKTEKIINLSFRNSGIITELNMKLGQKVKKGELLSKLDNVQSRLSYESAIEAKNSAESQMNTAKLNLNRIRTLYEKGSASLSDYESAKNSYRTAQASFESSIRSVAIQQEQVRFGYLYAPEDGAIASVIAEIDENVSPGQIVGVLNAGTAIEISLGLPESIINSVEKGMEVEVDFSSIPEDKFNAQITEVAPAIDQNTSTYPVTVMILEKDPRIKSGMAANVLFDFSDKSKGQEITVVPASAVGEDGDSRFVFLIEQDSSRKIVKKRAIEIGDLGPEGFVVRSGIKPGDLVVTAGLQTLLNGQEVKLNQD